MDILKYCMIGLLLSVISAGYCHAAETDVAYFEDETNDSLQTTYTWNEKWYYQAQFGVNYLAAENTRFVSIGKILSPAYTFSVGKRFSTLWGSRIQFLYGRDKGVYYDHDKDSPMFSFRHYGIIVEGTFNLANFIRNTRLVWDERKWNVDLKLGLGFIHSTSYVLADVQDYKWLNPVPRDNFAIYGGLELSRKIYKNLDLNIELGIHRLGNKYNGQVCLDRNTEIIGDLLATAMVGIRYTIPRRKPCQSTTVYINVPTTYSEERKEKEPLDLSRQEPKQDTENIVKVAENTEPDCYDIDELIEMANQGISIRGKKLCGLEMVHFDFDKSDIKPEFALYLDKLSILMNNCPDIKLLIMGHTDIKGSVGYNYDLSERRSKAVMAYLNQKGVHYDRMVYSYYSKLNPRTENKSDFGRSVNRRVEFMILP